MNFLDTNIVLYAFGTDHRRDPAQALLVSSSCVSVQVLNEFVSVQLRKFGAGWETIERALQTIDFFCGQALPLTAEDQRTAVALARDHNVPIYDAMIVTVALRAGCTHLYTEDFQHGRKFGALEVVNPFHS